MFKDIRINSPGNRRVLQVCSCIPKRRAGLSNLAGYCNYLVDIERRLIACYVVFAMTPPPSTYIPSLSLLPNSLMGVVVRMAVVEVEDLFLTLLRTPNSGMAKPPLKEILRSFFF